MIFLRFLYEGWQALLSEVMIFAVRCYQYTLSPWIGQSCRFQPTCSNYFIGAVRKYGPISGALRGAWRILRCNPLCKSGFDPP
ncbi:Putative membrane protein insertion efficiency factor [Bremerella volcania]|uniref:Putative membrane protein insertion efficiency factor n=1 Tax=Bremerella volcania TaxID=2527984 RepID=A0A518C7W4_9BACT|nr:membrane protein insertion efficiency factor YidD [Bremerella volcania]QDU75326.1 Putative membrane protein insertion efficiency factor [Bremerella volcania]